MFKNRYLRNGTTIAPEQTRMLHDISILVAGCGGLGGHIIELLVRAGVGHITAVDPDVFDETNLNRQLYSEESLLGTSKVRAAKDRVRRINSEVELIPVQKMLNSDNAADLIKGHDLAMDALDNTMARFVLEKVAAERQIPLVHGAISGWYGQVSVIMPGDNLFEKIYPGENEALPDSGLGNPSFTPAVIAGFQVSEAIKVLTGSDKALNGQMLFIDLLENTFQKIDMN